MKKITCLLLLFISITCFSQTVKELEEEVRVVRLNNGETESSKKPIAFKLLVMDKLNAVAVDYLDRVYTMNNQQDSINLLFDRLVKENPKSPEPYILRAQARGLTLTQRIDFYKEAYKIDSLHTKVNNELGRRYYQLFINEYAKNQNKENLISYSTQSIKYFSNLYSRDKSYREALKYPLLQLATYLGNDELKKRVEQPNEPFFYFPLSAFVDLPTDWQTNFTVDVVRGGYKLNRDVSVPVKAILGVDDARFKIEWYSNSLRTLKEPVLTAIKAENAYRFTWLRSFHNLIVVGLLNTNQSRSIYWKECDKSGKMINEGTKVLSQKEWATLVTAIQSIDFWNMPTQKNEAKVIKIQSLHLDGAQWILEGAASGKYHVIDRWSSENDMKEVCMQFVKLTNLTIKSGEIY